MPYTPPSQQSPASSKPNSPALSRSSSYSEDGPRSPAVGRPAPPRSMSSSSYLRKHRRSPSITNVSDGAPPTPTDVHEPRVQASDFANHGSVRQSPPPVSNNLMPTGAVTTPPDSAESSDTDERGQEQRGRELGKASAKAELQELQKAVRAINLKKESSPDRVAMEFQQPISEPVSQSTSPTALTAEARKISHSRSSTETKIMIPKSTAFDSPTGTSDDSEDDDGVVSKPSLVRKKSGELVKPALRPSSRRRYSSMPGTPTYSKSVHFNEQGNQTRHFLQVDKPIAVSTGTSPVDGYDSETEFPFNAMERQPEREIRLCNFPADTFDRRSKPIRVERIFLSQDKQSLIGVCAVQNIAFHKLVVARFTLDYWKTTSEVVAEYNNNPRNPSTDGCDRFNFNIKLSDQANVDNKTLLLCMRYNVSGQEFWDNNDNTNYQIDFVKASKPAPQSAPPTAGLGARPLTSIPRSKHSPPTSSRGRQESIDDDFSTRFDTDSTYSFGSPDQLLGESNSSIKLKPRSKRGSLFPADNGGQPSHGGLGGRYDFSNSLSAALSSAQDKLGQRSGLMNPSQRAARGSYFGPVDRVDGPTKAIERPDALTTERPAMGSDQYRDLVQKFCYFTPGSGGKPAASSPTQSATTTSKPSPSILSATGANAAANADGADDNDTNSTSSVESDAPSPMVDDNNNNEQRVSPALSPFISRSASPAPFTGGGMGGRAASPISFGYPYHGSVRDGYLSESHTPTAIQG